MLSENWREREQWLTEAYEKVAEIHNSLKITKPLPTKTSNYHERSYLVIHADVFAEAIREEIKDAQLRSIKGNFGSVDQFVDSTDVLSYPQIFKKLRIWSND